MSQSLSNTKENVTASGLRKFAKEYTMLLFVIVLVIACMLFVDRFATPGNLMNVLIQIAINALIATGMTFVILSDGIDLSVGSVAALAGVVATATIKMFPDAGRGLSVLVILLAAIVVGGICGSINAFSVAKLNVPPFIATLAMMNIARGLAFVYTDSKPVFDLPDSYGWVGLRSIGPIPVTVIVMIIVLAAAYIILSRTCFLRGRQQRGSCEAQWYQCQEDQIPCLYHLRHPCGAWRRRAFLQAAKRPAKRRAEL